MKRTGSKWTQKDETLLLALKDHHSVQDLSSIFGRTERAILKKITMMDPHRIPQPQSVCWSAADEKFLVANYGKKSIKELAHALNRTQQAIRGRLTRLKLNPAARVQKPGKRRANRVPNNQIKLVGAYIMKYDGRNWTQIGTR